MIKIIRLLSLLVPLILVCQTSMKLYAGDVVCPVTEKCLEDAMVSYKNGDIQKALKIYRHLSAEIDDPRLTGISSFMAGHIMAQLMLEGAEEYLKKAHSSYPLIGDYALFRLAAIHEKRGEYNKAADLYKTIHRKYPDSALHRKSLLKAADTCLVAGKIEEARGAYENYLSLYPKDRNVSSALYGLGMSYLFENNIPLAYDHFKRIWIYHPASPDADNARKRMEGFDGSGYALQPLTSGDAYIRGENLYEAGRYEDALVEYRIFLSGRTGISGADEKEAYFKSGMSNYRLRSWGKAEDDFEFFLEKYPDHKRAAEVLYWLGRTYLRQGKEEAFINASKRYIKQYKNTKKGPEVLYRLAVIYADKNDINAANVYYDRLIREYPKSSYASDSQWAKGWLMYKKKNLKGALREFDKIIRHKNASSYLPQALYWKARVLESMNDHQGMEKSLCKLCREHEGSFYCRFAGYYNNVSCASTVNLTGMETGGNIKDSDDLISNENNQDARILLLFYLGFREEAVEEVKWLRRNTTIDKKRSISLASTLAAMGEYYSALHIVYSNFSKNMLYSGRAVDTRVWRLMYPEGYSVLVNRYAEENNVDPLLLYALIREESWFNVNAVSPVGALGLMQLMPKTAASLVEDTHITRESLFDPVINIALGTRFLAGRLKQFDGNIFLALASYNAGPAAVTRWVKERDGFELDEFIEDIPYRETRNYVKKVFSSYIEYLRINQREVQREAQREAQRDAQRSMMIDTP